MENGFQKITFSRILRVEELQQLQHELLIDHTFTDGGLKVGALEKPQEKFVDQLQVRPTRFQRRIVFLRVEIGIFARRQGPKQVGRYL